MGKELTRTKVHLHMGTMLSYRLMREIDIQELRISSFCKYRYQDPCSIIHDGAAKTSQRPLDLEILRQNTVSYTRTCLTLHGACSEE